MNTIDDIPQKYQSLRRRLQNERIIYVNSNKFWVVVGTLTPTLIVIYQSYASLPSNWDYVGISRTDLETIEKAAQECNP